MKTLPPSDLPRLHPGQRRLRPWAPLFALGTLLSLGSGCERPGVLLHIEIDQGALEGDLAREALITIEGSDAMTFNPTTPPSGEIELAYESTNFATLIFRSDTAKWGRSFDVLLVPSGKKALTVTLGGALFDAARNPIAFAAEAQTVKMSTQARTTATIRFACNGACSSARNVLLTSPPSDTVTAIVDPEAGADRIVPLAMWSHKDNTTQLVAAANNFNGATNSSKRVLIYNAPAASTAELGTVAATIEVLTSYDAHATVANVTGDDGEPDLILSVRTLSGRVYVIEHSAIQNAVDKKITLEAEGPFPPGVHLIRGDDATGQAAEFGDSITAGDINGDGFDDVVIGAPAFPNPAMPADPTNPTAGALYVVFGGVTLPSRIDVPNAAFVARVVGTPEAGTAGESSNDTLGNSIAVLSSESARWIASGATRYQKSRGRVHVVDVTGLVPGVDKKLSDLPFRTIRGSSNSGFGHSLVSGNLSASGAAPQLFVSAPGPEKSTMSRGSVYAFTFDKATTADRSIEESDSYNLQIPTAIPGTFGTGLAIVSISGNRSGYLAISDPVAGYPYEAAGTMRGSLSVYSSEGIGEIRADETRRLTAAPTRGVFGVAKEDGFGSGITIGFFNTAPVVIGGHAALKGAFAIQVEQ